MSDDPFAREKAIRKGELDHEMPGYEELTGWFQRVPKTWLPGLLIRLTRHCAHGVFEDEQAFRGFLAKATEAALHPNPELRNL